MTDKPIVAEEFPALVDLEPGTYYWCACGRSKNQPFCDRSHEGTAFEPVKFEVKTTKKLKLCQCKQTGTPPYCDNTHSKLESP